LYAAPFFTGSKLGAEKGKRNLPPETGLESSYLQKFVLGNPTDSIGSPDPTRSLVLRDVFL
jgi:hypothetical protein